MKKPYDDCVGHVRGFWVRAYKQPDATGVTFGVELYTVEEARELARLLLEAADKLGPKGTGSGQG